MKLSWVFRLSVSSFLVLSACKTCSGDFTKIKPAYQQSFNERLGTIFDAGADEHQLKERLYETQRLTEGLNGKEVLERSHEYLKEQSVGIGSEVSKRCMNHASLFMEALTRQQGWALDAWDSFGKPGSGLLRLQTKWFGSFDECIGVKVNLSGIVSRNVAPFQMQYCMVLATLSNNKSLNGPMAELGTCFPDTCSSDDVKLVLDGVLQRMGLNFTLRGVTCHDKNLQYDAPAIAALTVVALFLVLMVLGTCYDITYIQLPQWQAEKNKNQISYNSTHSVTKESLDNGAVSSDERTPLVTEEQKPKSITPGIGGKLLLSFSVYTNGKKILNTKQSSDSLRAVHGVRFISMTWVIMGHTYFYCFPSVSNLVTKMPEAMSRWTYDVISNALVSVDSFFTLSGLLVSYLALSELKKGAGRINWFMFYFHRYWRLTPPYLLVMFVYVTLFHYVTDGPVYPQTSVEPGCKDNFWLNMFYVQNIVKSDDLCMSWTWYLANDMQFYILSPLIIVPFYFSLKLGVISTLVFLLTTFITSGVLSARYQLPVSMFQIFITPGGKYFVSDFYTKPWCRIGPYIMGVLAGCILHRTKCEIRMSKIVCLIGWLAAAGTCLAVVYGVDQSPTAKPPPNDVAAFYNAISRTAWGAGVAWVIIACATGNGGYVNTLLSWEGLIPLSRLTYCAYLVHPVVIKLYIMSQSTAMAMSDINLIYMFFGNLVAAYIVAFVTSLMFEAPMMGLEKAVLSRGRKN